MARSKTNPTIPLPSTKEPVKKETLPKIEKRVALKNTNPIRNVFIANQHTAAIVIPRSVPAKKGTLNRIALVSLTFPSGTVTSVNAEIWGNIKAGNAMVREYLDLTLLAEVPQLTGIVATISKTSDLRPPEHLQTSNELKDDSINTRIERETVGDMSL